MTPEPSTASVGASVGVARIAGGMSAAEVLRQADTAMCEAKRQGGDRYRIFAPPVAAPAHVA